MWWLLSVLHHSLHWSGLITYAFNNRLTFFVCVEFIFSICKIQIKFKFKFKGNKWKILSINYNLCLLFLQQMTKIRLQKTTSHKKDPACRYCLFLCKVSFYHFSIKYNALFLLLISIGYFRYTLSQWNDWKIRLFSSYLYYKPLRLSELLSVLVKNSLVFASFCNLLKTGKWVLPMSVLSLLCIYLKLCSMFNLFPINSISKHMVISSWGQM